LKTWTKKLHVWYAGTSSEHLGQYQGHQVMVKVTRRKTWLCVV